MHADAIFVQPVRNWLSTEFKLNQNKVLYMNYAGTVCRELHFYNRGPNATVR